MEALEWQLTTKSQMQMLVNDAIELLNALILAFRLPYVACRDERWTSKAWGPEVTCVPSIISQFVVPVLYRKSLIFWPGVMRALPNLDAPLLASNAT